MSSTDLSLPRAQALALFRRKRLIAFSAPAVLLVYLIYVFFAFDVPGLVERARMDNAITLASDSWSYKTHVTRTHATGEMDYAIEGERKGAYPPGERPAWVTDDGDALLIDLGDGHVVRFLPDNVTQYDVPGHGLIEIALVGRSLQSNLGDTPPDWINASSARIAITTDAGRVTVTRSKSEVFR